MLFNNGGPWDASMLQLSSYQEEIKSKRKYVLHISLIPKVITLKISWDRSRFLKSQESLEEANLTHTYSSFACIFILLESIYETRVEELGTRLSAEALRTMSENTFWVNFSCLVIIIVIVIVIIIIIIIIII